MDRPPSKSKYPLPTPPESNGDRRFTLGLVVDVRSALLAHNYPEFTGTDLVELELALFRFLYAPREGSSRG